METTYDDIDKFITTVYGTNSVRALARSISIPLGVIMHLKALCFELDDRNRCDTLSDAEMLAAINTVHTLFISITSNQDSQDTERQKIPPHLNCQSQNILHQTLKVSWTT